jgi:hypothetical protein
MAGNNWGAAVALYAGYDFGKSQSVKLDYGWAQSAGFKLNTPMTGPADSISTSVQGSYGGSSSSSSVYGQGSYNSAWGASGAWGDSSAWGQGYSNPYVKGSYKPPPPPPEPDYPVKAKPVEYVKVCSLYGAGFYYIPGTDTCIKLGGYVRMEIEYGTLRTDDFRSQTAYSTRRTDDVRQQTAYGTLRTYMQLSVEQRTFDQFGTRTDYGAQEYRLRSRENTWLPDSGMPKNTETGASSDGVRCVDGPAGCYFQVFDPRTYGLETEYGTLRTIGLRTSIYDYGGGVIDTTDSTSTTNIAVPEGFGATAEDFTIGMRRYTRLHYRCHHGLNLLDFQTYLLQTFGGLFQEDFGREKEPATDAGLVFAKASGRARELPEVKLTLTTKARAGR